MRKALAIPSILAAALLLSACGFQSLYGERANGTSVSNAVRDVEIAPQTTRIGQLVRNELLSGVAPASAGGNSRYILNFTTSEKDEADIIAFNTDSRHHRYVLDVEFSLTERGNGRKVFGGKTFSEVTYTKTRQPVAAMQARINAAERAARIVAGDIHTRLAAFFASRS